MLKERRAKPFPEVLGLFQAICCRSSLASASGVETGSKVWCPQLYEATFRSPMTHHVGSQKIVVLVDVVVTKNEFHVVQFCMSFSFVSALLVLRSPLVSPTLRPCHFSYLGSLCHHESSFLLCVRARIKQCCPCISLGHHRVAVLQSWGVGDL